MKDIQCDGLLDQSDDCGLLKGRMLPQLKRCHLVPPAWLEPGLDVPQPLTAPEAEQNPAGLCSNEKHRPIGEIHEMTPFDGLGYGRCSQSRCTQGPDIELLPVREGSDVCIWIGRWE